MLRIYLLTFCILTFVTLGLTRDHKIISFNGIQKEHSVSFDISSMLESAQIGNKSIQITMNCNSAVRFSFAKCNKTIIVSSDEVRMRRVTFQDEWIGHLLNLSKTSCNGQDKNTNQLDFNIRPVAETSGYLTFITVDRLVKNITTTTGEPHFVVSQTNETTVHKVYVTPNSSDAVTSSNSTIHLMADLSSPAKLHFAKCEMILPDNVFLTGKDDILIHKSLLVKLLRLADLFCATANHDNSFEMRVTTIRNGSGAIFLKKKTAKEQDDLVAFGIPFVLFCVLLAGIFYLHKFITQSCCQKKAITKSGMDIYLKKCKPRSMPNRCDSCGEDIDSHAK